MFGSSYFGGSYFGAAYFAPSGPPSPPTDPNLRLWASDSAGVGITQYDLATYHIHGIKVTYSYGQPSRMEFTVNAAQQSKPIPDRARIWLTDDAYAPWGTPVFEGHVDQIIPADCLQVRYVCYGATKRAAAECYIMSLPYTVDGSGPVEGTGAVPHLVFNVKTDQDEEIAWSRDNDASLATILTTILDDSKHNLAPLMAAPTGGGVPYVTSQHTDLTFKPQDKVVFVNETVPNGIERTLQLAPQFRAFFKPGDNDRQWHVHDLTAAAQKTFTLNDYTTETVLSLSFASRAVNDRRYSAVKIYGPRKTVLYNAYVGSGGGASLVGTLSETWSALEESAFETLGPEGAGIGDAGKVWQITDATKRNLASRLPSDGTIPFDGSFGTTLKFTRLPTLVVTFDGGTTWETVADATIDLLNGKVIARNRVYRHSETASPPFQLPDDVRFLCAYYDTPLSVRYPETPGTFSGTAYSVAGMQAEMKIYDPGLAVGWEDGTPVAEATRTAQYQEVAERLHAAVSDIAYAGGLTLVGINYDYIHLGRRLNFAAVDGNGVALTTNWEAINAPLTEVEFDYESRTTTLQFNGDQMELLAVDPESLKVQLRISAEQFTRDRGTAITLNFGGGFSTTFFANANGGGQSPYYRDDSTSAQYGVDSQTGRPLSEGGGG